MSDMRNIFSDVLEFLVRFFKFKKENFKGEHFFFIKTKSNLKTSSRGFAQFHKNQISIPITKKSSFFVYTGFNCADKGKIV